MNLNPAFNGFANLFNIKERVENGPTMGGRIKADGAAEDDEGIRIAAFPKQGKESGRDYLSLSIGNKEGRVYGSLFANDRKAKENDPDFTGSIELSKTEKLYVAGWNKTGDAAGPYISLKIQPPMAKPEGEAGETAESTPAPAEAAA